ncbi:SdrD B-like domain-containing protein [Celeribacter sp.]|uniref:DUF7507 domain-containing protein n=1 Tax=Celeribacter sp. TaxID=1890673 RepID=UPI003A92A640
MNTGLKPTASFDLKGQKATSLRAAAKSILTFAMLSLGVGALAPANASAQSYDWVVNVNDAGSDPTVAGGDVTYNITVNNNVSVTGAGEAPETVIDLDIPAGGILKDVTNTTCDPALPITGPAAVSCVIPALAEDETFALSAIVTSTESGTITLTGGVPSTNDVAPANNIFSETTTILSGADVALEVNGPTEANSGEVVTYTYTLDNNGPDTVTEAVVEIPAITGLTVTSVPSYCSASGGGYLCTIPTDIPDDGTFSFDLTGQVIAAGTGSSLIVSGTAEISEPQDPLTDDNSASLITQISDGSDVRLTKSNSAPGTVLVGDPVIFTLSPSFTGGVPYGLEIADSVPSAYQIDSVDVLSGGWNCTVSGQDLNCTRPSDGLVAGTNVPLGDILINTTAIAPGSVSNSATVSSSGPEDTNLGNNTDTDGGRTIENPVVDLSVSKTGPSPALVVVGNEYEFNLRTQNTGNADFYGTLYMTDSLPAGMTFTGYDGNGWTCSPAAPQAGPVDVVCELVYTAGVTGPLAPGANTPIAVIRTEATQSGNLTNTASVSSPEYPGVGDSDSYDVDSSADSASADITVNKTVAASVVTVGDIQTYYIEVVNAGPAASADVTVTDPLLSLINNQVGATDAGLVSITAPAGATCGSTARWRGRDLSCTFDTLPVCTAGSTCPVIEVQVRPGGNAGQRSNTVQVLSSSVADPDLTNNDDTVTFDIEARTDVTVTKTATPVTAIVGQNLSYVVTALNPSTEFFLSNAPDTTITDVLPDGLIFVSATPTTGSCSTLPTVGSETASGNNQVVCNLGTVTSGGQQAVEIVVQPTEALVGSVMENIATVSTSLDETDDTNNSASVQTTVAAPSYDLQVNKVDSIDPVAVGEEVTYTVTIRNNGPSAAENVTMNDLMPAQYLNYQSHNAGTGVCGTVPSVGQVGGTLSCSFDRIEAGGSRVVTILAQGVQKGTATNTANLTSPGITNGYDPLPANNEVTENTTVRTRADVEVVSKVASKSPVELLETFDFVITVRNNTGSDGGVVLAEADGVEVTDSLPANMVLAGMPSVNVTSGSATLQSCDGAAGGTSFTCELGTFTSGATAEITVPVKITSVTSDPQSFTNTAEITTTSLDVDPNNNENSGPVEVVSSTLSGTVFRDFDDNGDLDVDDSGVAGVTVTLTGTAFDGTPVSVSATTDANGNYSISNLPRGTYTVTRGAVSETYVEDGQAVGGSEGGNPTGATEIATINLPSDTDATDYDFTLVPQARIGIAKRVSSGPTSAADGSFTVGFSFVVENFSLEPLDTVVVTDALSGAAPLFGSYANLSNPATDDMVRGTYTILSAPSGSCGALNAGFNGESNQTLVSGTTLAVGATCEISLSLRVRPEVPLPNPQASGGVYENQATVTGNGTWTEQTPGDNPLLTDLSDDGTDPDPNGNGRADEPGENDPTPVTPIYEPAIALVKSATTAFSDPPVPGEEITYSFAITNTGSQTLTDVTLTDAMLEGVGVLTGSPIASLAPGATDDTTYSAVYELTQEDIDRGYVENTALVTGTDPFDEEVTDTSGTSQDNDTPTTTPLTRNAAIELIKTADATNVSDPSEVGQIVTYSFTVTNTGNVTLTDVTLADILPGIVWETPGASIAEMAPGAVDTDTFKASYALTQADLDAGQLVNEATVTADSVVGEVSDTDDETVPLGQSPSIELEKTVDNSGLTQTIGLVGEELEYTFKVTNTGTVTLTNVTITDPLLGANQISEVIPSLAPGEEYTFTEKGIYAVTQADIDAGEVLNTATATGTYGEDGNGGDLTVDDEDDAVAETVFIEAIPETPWEFDTDGGITTSMLASDMIGQEQATLDNVTITVVDSDPALTLDPSTGLITLSEGNPAGTYEVTYEICRIDNPLVCDQATETVIQRPISAIEAVKTQELTDNGDGVDGVGDLMTYTITVENIGNTTVNDVALEDTFLTLTTGQTLTLDSGPTFVSASEGSSDGTLVMGETATYTATFELTIEAVDAGGLSNQILATAMPEYPDEFTEDPTEVADLSDDGDDGDGNTEDDPTEYPLEPLLYDSGLVLRKTTPRGVVERGAVVPYSITVTNENPRTSGTMDLMDVLPADFVYVEGTATWDGEPIEVTVQGKVVTWPSVTVPPLTTIEATLSARVLTSADVGDHVNRARLRDSTTREPLSPEATATVSIFPEPVFDCGDVYGKVFNDMNRDGYQNAPVSRIVDEDAIFSGKYSGKGDAPVELDREIVENGIPAVRLTGVDGTVITTDQYGRFHVPCAMLPEDRGSNFILKLDTRSLPTGYRLTTENPRVVRLTPGKMTELNFGAALTRVVRVDVNAQGFAQTAAGPKMTPALETALAGLVQQIAGEPVHLRIAYHLPDEAGSAEKRLARQSMRQVERELRDLWREPGRVKLTIEKTIVRVEQ